MRPKVRDEEFARRIRLNSIERIVVGREDNFKVTITFDPQYESDVSLAYTVFVAAKEFDEANALAIARNWFHGMCKLVAENTEDWTLTDEQFEALKKPVKTSQKNSMQP